MKKIMVLLSFLAICLGLIACGAQKQQTEDGRWSKPQRVIEGCDGVMSNSQQCQKNPGSQQMLIQIDRN